MWPRGEEEVNTLSLSAEEGRERRCLAATNYARRREIIARTNKYCLVSLRPSRTCTINAALSKCSGTIRQNTGWLTLSRGFVCGLGSHQSIPFRSKHPVGKLGGHCERACMQSQTGAYQWRFRVQRTHGSVGMNAAAAALLCLNQLIGDVVVVVPTADVFINFAQLATDE